jgi:hypothetical protein
MVSQPSLPIGHLRNPDVKSLYADRLLIACTAPRPFVIQDESMTDAR